MLTIEPSDITQIILGQWIGGIKHDQMDEPGIFGLKTPHGKYISSDFIGRVYYEREAIGPSEEWVPVFSSLKFRNGLSDESIEDSSNIKGLSFRRIQQGKYLSFDSSSGFKAFRADSESITNEEIFVVKIQSEKTQEQRGKYFKVKGIIDESVPTAQLSSYEQSQL